MKTLMEMGHSDEIIIADGNYPVHSQGVKVIRADGLEVAPLLSAILDFLPLDSYSDCSVALMEVVKGDPTLPLIWEEYKSIIEEKGYSLEVIENIDRFDFYERSKKAFAIIATSDKVLYANILLKKGVV
jgi:L-fucose mutarotase